MFFFLHHSVVAATIRFVAGFLGRKIILSLETLLLYRYICLLLWFFCVKNKFAISHNIKDSHAALINIHNFFIQIKLHYLWYSPWSLSWKEPTTPTTTSSSSSSWCTLRIFASYFLVTVSKKLLNGRLNAEIEDLYSMFFVCFFKKNESLPLKSVCVPR